MYKIINRENKEHVFFLDKEGNKKERVFETREEARSWFYKDMIVTWYEIDGLFMCVDRVPYSGDPKIPGTFEIVEVS